MPEGPANFFDAIPSAVLEDVLLYLEKSDVVKVAKMSGRACDWFHRYSRKKRKAEQLTYIVTPEKTNCVVALCNNNVGTTTIRITENFDRKVEDLHVTEVCFQGTTELLFNRRWWTSIFKIEMHLKAGVLSRYLRSFHTMERAIIHYDFYADANQIINSMTSITELQFYGPYLRTTAETFDLLVRKLNKNTGLLNLLLPANSLRCSLMQFCDFIFNVVLSNTNEVVPVSGFLIDCTKPMLALTMKMIEDLDVTYPDDRTILINRKPTKLLLSVNFARL